MRIQLAYKLATKASADGGHQYHASMCSSAYRYQLITTNTPILSFDQLDLINLI